MRNATALNLAVQILENVSTDMVRRTRGIVFKDAKERRKATADILKLERIKMRLIRFSCRLEDPVTDIGNTYEVTGQEPKVEIIKLPKGLIK